MIQNISDYQTVKHSESKVIPVIIILDNYTNFYTKKCNNLPPPKDIFKYIHK